MHTEITKMMQEFKYNNSDVFNLYNFTKKNYCTTFISREISLISFLLWRLRKSHKLVFFNVASYIQICCAKHFQPCISVIVTCNSYLFFHCPPSTFNHKILTVKSGFGENLYTLVVAFLSFFFNYLSCFSDLFMVLISYITTS